jgi:hypothetical protein
MTQPISTPAPNRRADEETWAQARDDYENGVSPRLIAERYGLGERHVRRRAASEDWPRRPGGGRTHVSLPDPELVATFDEDRRLELNELLMRPGPDALARFAFRRATEAAALGAPSETLGWLRVVDQIRRNGASLEAAEEAYHPTDYLRAHYADTLAKVTGEDVETVVTDAISSGR